MKVLKKILKITGITLGAIVVLMILSVILAKVFESELASFAVEKLEGEIDAPMSVGKVSLIPLFSFPRISAEIEDLWIGDPKSKNRDTLLFIQSLKVGLDSWDLINGNYKVEKAEVSGLDFDYAVDKSGKSNIDFLMYAFVDTTAVSPEIPEDSTAAPLNFALEKCKLQNIRIHYTDSLSNMAALLDIPEINLKAKTKNDIIKGKAEGNFVVSQCFMESTKLDLMEACTVNFDVEIDDTDISIQNMQLSSEGINLSMIGALQLNDTLVMDASLKANTLDLGILKKYIPDEYLDIFDGNNPGKIEPLNLNLNLAYADEYAKINKMELRTKGLDLGFEGTLGLSDTLTVDADFSINTLNLDILKKYIPKLYLDEYGINDLGGIAEIYAKIKGQYADSTLLPLVDATINFKNIRLQSRDYPEIKKLDMAAQITNGVKASLSEAKVKLTNLEIFTPQSSMKIQGTVYGIETPIYSINTSLDINLAEFKNYIPDSLAKNPKGQIIASMQTSGTLPKTIPDDFADYVLDRTTLSITASDMSATLMDSLQIDNFSIRFSYLPQNAASKKIQINSLDLKSEPLHLNLQNSSMTAILIGKLTDPEKLAVKLPFFKIQNGSNAISGSADIKNFDAPEFDVKTKINLDLAELMVFAPDSLIENMTGTIEAQIQSAGKINLDSLEAQMYPLLFENSSFDLSFDNLNFSFADTMMNIGDISAHLNMKNDLLKIDDFSATYNGLTFAMDSTLVQNIYKAYLLNQKEELYVKTHIRCGDIFYKDFEWLMTEDTTTAQLETDTLTTPEEPQNWTFLIHGTAAVNSFIMDSTIMEGYKINRLHLHDISTLFKLTDSAYIFDQFKFKAFEGETNNAFHYRLREDGTESVSSRHTIKKMNIHTLLRDMDNFGMDSIISYNNLSGLVSSDFDMFIPIDDSVLLDKMMLSVDLTLEEGGVYDYPPAQEMSKFTRIKELDNIQFKTLRSNLFLFKNKMYVPRTNIVSNALDIAAFGMQSMDYDYDYHLEIHLSNILFGKSKKRNKKQAKGGDEIDAKSLKKSSHKIRYADVGGDSKVGIDTKAAREDMMNKIRVQQKMLDFIFFPKNIHYETDVPPRKNL